MRDEPPIASPFGDAPNRSNFKSDAPRLLKGLVWLQFGLTLCGIAFSAKDTPTNSPVPPLFLALLLIFALGLSLIPLGLLRASNASWWFTQTWFVFGILTTAPSLFRQTARFGSSPPALFQFFAWMVGFVLFAYLLTPAMRHFFFTPNRENSD